MSLDLNFALILINGLLAGLSLHGYGLFQLIGWVWNSREFTEVLGYLIASWTFWLCRLYDRGQLTEGSGFLMGSL